MYPNNPQPNPGEPQQPSAPSQPPTPFIDPQPVQQPSFDTEAPKFQAPQTIDPQPQPMPVSSPSFDSNPNLASTKNGNKLITLLNGKAGILSLVAFAIGFLILSVATIIKINDAISILSAYGAQYGAAIIVPSLFELTKDSITNWVFVIVVSAPWWILGLLPAVALAVYSLVKQGLRNTPAVATIALSLAIFINIIVK